MTGHRNRGPLEAMVDLVNCASCLRPVRVGEPACPFCGRELPQAASSDQTRVEPGDMVAPMYGGPAMMGARVRRTPWPWWVWLGVGAVAASFVVMGVETCETMSPGHGRRSLSGIFRGSK